MVGILVEEVKTLWFTKSRRAQNVDDYETWIEGGVMPTLNSFDNGDVRTTVIVFHPHYHDGARVQGDTMNTLTSRMGTGGNNVSGVATIFSHTQGLDAQPSETVSPTLRAGGAGMAAQMESNVRRLTPVECERLQGFPDDWTEGQSDSHRYKQMGNAVAVPVVEWIIQGISDTL
jgi:site-specific DNA-cytosine methylase